MNTLASTTIFKEDEKMTQTNQTIRRTAAAAGVKPVSYTHLDVYKRQDFSCLCGDTWYSAPYTPGATSLFRVSPVFYPPASQCFRQLHANRVVPYTRKVLLKWAGPPFRASEISTYSGNDRIHNATVCN